MDKDAEGIRKKYRTVLIAIILTMGIVLALIYFTSVNQLLISNQIAAEESIVDVKKTFLKDTVNNVILEIEKKQDLQLIEYQNTVNEVMTALDFYYSDNDGVTDDDFLSASLQYLKAHENRNICMQVRLISSGEVLYQNFDSSDTANLGEGNEASYPVFQSKDFGDYAIALHVNKESIDADIKSQMAELIHSYQYSENAYIWVNQVRNYSGGEDYAVRLIHPNLIETEGMLLSTDMTDAAGGHPYMTELEGINEDGELFFTYFFKKKDVDVISEKITYAKLYGEYDWIIAMGIHLDDIESYVQKTTDQSQQSVQRMVSLTALLVVLLVAVASISISVLETWYHRSSDKELKKNVYIDSITGLFNRRAGERHLKDAFGSFQHTGRNSAVFMIDIDDFKSVNDSCGHDKGDMVLIQVANALNGCIRATDTLCRWGGEEFIIICQGIKSDSINQFSRKLLDAVYNLNHECNSDAMTSKVTISIGVSGFNELDTDSANVVKRADKALYQAKGRGKNQAVIFVLDDKTASQ